MPYFSNSPVFFLPIFLFLVFALCSLTVRSEDVLSALRLPTDHGDDLCRRSAAPASCPVSCFRTDPVCGVDGVTYWCGCADAICAGTPVAKLGFCEVGNGGNGRVSGQAFYLIYLVWFILLGFLLLSDLL